MSFALEKQQKDLEIAESRLQEVGTTHATETQARLEAEAVVVELRGRLKTQTNNASDREKTLSAEIEALKAQVQNAEQDADTAKRGLSVSTEECERLREECASSESAVDGLRAQCSTLET